MKKLATLAMAAAVISLAAGCSAPVSPAVTSTPPTSPYFGSAATDGPKPNKTLWDYQSPVMKDKAFYAEARQGTTTLAGFADDKLTTVAQIACASVANGETSKDVLLERAMTTATGSTDGLTAEAGKDLAGLLAVGSKNYCPDLGPQFTKILA